MDPYAPIALYLADILADNAEELLYRRSTSQREQEHQLLICNETLGLLRNVGAKGTTVDKLSKILKTYSRPPQPVL